jgi:hypothetical protein
VEQLSQPSGGVLGGIVKDAVFDALKHHVVRSLDLAVAARVHRRVVDIDEAILAKILEVKLCEGCSQVDDDSVGYAKAVVSSMNFAASFDMTVVMARTSIHFVNLSTATRMCL